jgi:hypothetical protein
MKNYPIEKLSGEELSGTHSILRPTGCPPETMGSRISFKFFSQILLIFQNKLNSKTRICIKNTFFKEKLFTTEVQGILKGAWLVRRL